MSYTKAQTNAMNKQGAALLKAQANGTYKPPITKPASSVLNKSSTNGATTLAVGGSRASDYVQKPATPSPISTVGLGNQKTGSSGGSSSSTGRETITKVAETEKPAWLDGTQSTSGGTTNGNTSPDISQSYNDLKEATIKMQVEGLGKALNNSLSNLDDEQAAISPYYYDKRNQAAARTDVTAMNFAQRAAARGISGNAGSMPEIYRQSDLQGQIGALDQAEAARNAEIERNRSTLRNNYESDLIAARAGIEAKALQNHIDQMNADRAFSLQEAGVTGKYNGSATLEAQAQQLENQMAKLQIDAQEIQNSYLPQTLKDEADLLKQQVESGRVSINTALAQLAKIKSGRSTSSDGMTFAQALDAWNSGIDTPAIRSKLGIK